MMRTPFLRLLSFGAALAVFGGATVAVAGQVYSNPVVISSANGYFQGMVATARYSGDYNQDIGCNVIGSTPPMAVCWATDASNHYVSCYTDDPNLVAAAGLVNSASNILAYYSQSTADCTYIRVGSGSNFLH
jgi:hypothetical protein